MKKVLLPLFALALSFVTANAQGLRDKALASGNTIVVAKESNVSKVRKAPMAKADELTKNQKYVGLSGCTSPYNGMGLPAYPMVKKAGTFVDPSVLTKYAGCKVVGMRFSIFTSIGSKSTNVYLGEVKNGTDESGKFTNVTDVAAGTIDGVKTATISNNQITDMGWNTVMFDEPYTIPSTPVGLMFGYEYTQKNTKSGNNYTDACFPLFCGLQQSSAEGVGLCAYGDIESTGTSSWYAVSTQYALCMQLIVQKDDGFVKDLQMLGISTPRFLYNKEGQTIPVAFAVTNFGSDPVEQSTYTVTVDGKSVATLTSPSAIDGNGVVLNGDVNLPSGIQAGVHNLSIKVASMEEQDPTGDTSDDEIATEFRVYDNLAGNHQYQLLEHITSWTCGFCPYGYNMIRYMMQNRNDVAWVAIHGDQVSTQPDPYTVSDAQYIMNYALIGWPTGVFNRYLYVDSQINPSYNLGLSISVPDESYYKNYLALFNDVFAQSNHDVPSQVRLDLSTNFDPSTGKLAVTVKGTGVKNAAKVLEGTTLTVYLTENGLSGRQYFYSNLDASDGGAKWVRDFEHENTLRQILTQPWGDAITWNGDNFEATYEVDVDADNYDYDNGNTLNCVAFVSNPFIFTQGDQQYWNANVDNVWVNNCIMQTVNEGQTTGISSVEGSADNATVVARYAADGTQVSAPVKGINILKMSDGTTRKVVLK